jgi:hypothetical protein
VATLVVAASLAAAAPASAEMYRVTGFADEPSPTACAPSTQIGFTFDCTSLRGAVAAANAAPDQDAIVLSPGTYSVTGPALVLQQAVTVTGASARTTTVQGNGSNRVFTTGTGADATLSLMTITGGFSSDSGGNIAVSAGAQLGLVFARVTGGIAQRGAGIANQGTLTVVNSLVDNNSAQILGGGIDNVAVDGPATVVVGSSTVADNYAAEGAGISSRGSAQNSVDLLNATIARNRGSSGIWFEQQQEAGAFGSIVAGNATSSCTGNGTLTGDFNVDDGTSCGLSATTNRVATDPSIAAALSDQGGYTNVLTIPAGSPAADYVSLCPGGLDQRGWTRPQGPCDAGAYDRDAVDTGVGGGGGEQQPPPTPTPQPPAPTPTPTPVVNQTAVVRETRGTVKVQLPGSKTFVDLDATRGIPMGSTIDTRKGAVEITSVPKAGAPPEKAIFYDGLFKVTQSKGITNLTLVEQLDCAKKRSRASAAQKAKKPKKRKLWGDGKGAFRTNGRYSAATVRGTKWLVEDTCTSTTTKVEQGSVTVTHGKKRVVLRAGKRYIARAKK